MLLADACTEYVFSCKVRRLSEKTIDNYRKQILYWNRYLDEVCDVQEVEKVRPIHIKNFIILKEKDKRKPAYINDLLKAYRAFSTTAWRRIYRRIAPCKSKECKRTARNYQHLHPNRH